LGSNQRLELLAPAGNMEKLKVALAFGADAVYFAGRKYGLRSAANNFDESELVEAIKYCHELNRKAYVTVNIIPHNEHLEGLDEYVKFLGTTDVDGLIVSDPGVISIIKKEAPHIPIHLSTQANATNWMTVRFWKELGVKRIVLARELSLEEISEISKKVDIELETFVHGAMCISYSGRCLLSAFMTNRHANFGDCSHPCRWKYALVEEMRPGEYFPVFEDDYGTYILNSKDLCMIENIPDLVRSGVGFFKIEGRMKSVYYVASVTHAYRKAIDKYIEDPENYSVPQDILDEVYKVSHRPFTTGFYYKTPEVSRQNYEFSSYIRNYSFVGVVEKYCEDEGVAVVGVRNRLKKGDEVEFLRPGSGVFRQVIDTMIGEDGNELTEAHANYTVRIKTVEPVTQYTMMRLDKEGEEPDLV
jgi:putative protease